MAVSLAPIRRRAGCRGIRPFEAGSRLLLLERRLQLECAVRVCVDELSADPPLAQAEQQLLSSPLIDAGGVCARVQLRIELTAAEQLLPQTAMLFDIEVVGVELVRGPEIVIVATAQARGLLAKATEVNYLSGPGKGVILIKLASDDDKVLGFIASKGERDLLTVETTHLKPAYIRRNGLARSEKATVREHFIRNGDILTIVTIVSDPVYLTEPYIKSRNFQLDPGYHMTLYPCSVDVEIDRPAGEIPHYLPGANPFISEAAAKRVRDNQLRALDH